MPDPTYYTSVERGCLTAAMAMTKTMCLKGPSYAIFSKSREFEDIKYDTYDDHQNHQVHPIGQIRKNLPDTPESIDLPESPESPQSPDSL